MEDKKLLSPEMLEEISGGVADLFERSPSHEELLVLAAADSPAELSKLLKDRRLVVTDEVVLFDRMDEYKKKRKFGELA